MRLPSARLADWKGGGLMFARIWGWMTRKTRRQPRFTVEVQPRDDAFCIAVAEKGIATGLLVEVTPRADAPPLKKEWTIAAARGLARYLKAALVIKDKTGRIRKRDSSGYDPLSRKG
jgi:hypothetical protein